MTPNDGSQANIKRVTSSSTRVHLSSNAIAGTVAGFTSSVLTHPLDVVKTRFQVARRSERRLGDFPGTSSPLVYL